MEQLCSGVLVSDSFDMLLIIRLNGLSLNRGFRQTSLTRACGAHLLLGCPSCCRQQPSIATYRPSSTSFGQRRDRAGDSSPPDGEARLNRGDETPCRVRHAASCTATAFLTHAAGGENFISMAGTWRTVMACVESCIFLSRARVGDVRRNGHTVARHLRERR